MWFALSGRFMGESCRVKYLFTFELSANTKQRFMSGRVLVSLIQNSATGYIYFPAQTISSAHGTNASHTTNKQTNKHKETNKETNSAEFQENKIRTLAAMY